MYCRCVVIFRILLLVTAFGLPGKAYGQDEEGLAGGKISKVGSAAKRFSTYIPGGGVASPFLDMIIGGSVEDKVDRIESRQKTSLDRLREIAYDALETKRRIEDFYYFTKNLIEGGKNLAEGLKKGDRMRFLGALLEDGIRIPLNPAEYIPNIPEAEELRKNIEWDLSFERGVIGHADYLLSRTRSALMSTNLFRTNPKQFEKAYEQAVHYEQQVEKALSAKERALTKIYKKEVEYLEEELRFIERAKEEPGLTTGDIAKLEMAGETKRGEIRELHKEISKQLAASLTLKEEDTLKLAMYKAHRDAAILAQELAIDKQRIQAKYASLWSFWG
jgi:hypothetical protein